MLHLLLMGLGLLLGASMGGHDWLWGLALGFLFGEWIELRRRLGQLERERRPQSRRALAEPAAEPSGEAVAESAAEPRAAARAAPVAPLAWAREAEPPAATEDAWPPAPSAPPLIVRGARYLRRFFSAGNPLVGLGALVLLVGVALLLKYVGERITIPIEWRLAGVGAGGIALLALGIRLHFKRPDFALPVQGAGLGVCFLTLFAAFRLYQVLPSGAAFALLLVVVAVTVVLALWQDALVLAAFGVGGGFVAPVLTATGQGSHVELFGYYLILNAVVVGIAWFRAWRLLNWLGFVFTFGLGLTWGAEYYVPAYFASTEPFLIAHVGLYIGVAVLFASRQPPRLKGLVDGTIVFGTPLVGFAIQAAMLTGRPHALALSAAVLGTSYLLLAALLRWRDRRHYRLLCDCFLALGVGFVTLAVPLAFDARVTSALWCLEGAAVAWVGLRQRRLPARLGGYALMLLGSIAYLFEGPRAADSMVLVNADFLGCALIAAAFALTARLAARAGEALADRACWLYAMAWWLGGGVADLAAHLPAGSWHHWGLVWTSLSLAAGYVAARPLGWPEWRRAGIVHSPVPGVFLILLAAADLGLRPGWLGAAWLLAFALEYLLLYLDERPRGRWLPARHALSVVTLAAVLGYGLWHWARSVWGPGAALTLSLPALAPAVLAALIGWPGATAQWPLREHPRAYLNHALGPLGGWLLVWLLWVNLNPPPTFGWVGFRPLLNVLDLSCVVVLAVLVWHWRRLRRGADVAAAGDTLLAMAGFAWLNAALLRALHFRLEIPYRWRPLWESFTVQASLTLLWVVCGLGMMMAGARVGNRRVWIAGASLMGLAVIKLFFVDTAGSGTLARIVAFFGVAAALLVAGYLVPRPPASKA